MSDERWDRVKLLLAQALGLDLGMTCRRRLRDRNEAGVWQRLREFLLAELNVATS
ncbi:hypothetical protein OG407_34385 [Streptomyces sp. NBC_01515]|uniref:hypothetical protein n=1 Tax=Streptomyces sp. NBC_01515 TaxID=2903890 RepID=UPI00386539D3